MKYKNIREEELKNKVGADWFKQFDTTEILGNIDFTVFPQQDNLFGRTPLLWAEAKTGNFDVATMFVQLILTIGKARTFDKTMPPAFLGAFDFKKIAFVPYINIQDIFYLNDFNWNVTPSNHETKEFQLIKQRVEATLKRDTYVYDYEKDEKELQAFIKNNVAKATTASKLKIDKNNFIPIYLRWLEIIKPIIGVNWDDLKKANILDSDFYLADLFVDDKDTQTIGDDLSIRENLFVMFQNEGYKIAKENIKQMFDATITLKNKDTYLHFWKRYKRPPLKEFQDYIIERRDLLVPQDIRERKGAFFTPRIWVELSQKYLTDYLGENWQDDYYIWDCAAGTGNLLAGLTNKYNIYASTLDQADVNVMHERIDHGANLLKNNVFQFDFLNDDFSKLPQSLQDIINNEEKRKKLVIYINPPYAEATSSKTVSGTGENKSGVTTNFKINEILKPKIGNASNEIFALFMANIYEKIPGCILGQFSKMKFINGSNFKKFKDYFLADYVSGFIVPGDTFDNVKGKFPIGFTIWNTANKSKINTISTDVFDRKGNYNSTKNFYGELPNNINKWIKLFDEKTQNGISFMGNPSPDFQHDSQLYLSINKGIEHFNFFNFNKNNLIVGSIYFSIRNCIDAIWINDRDQYLFPNDGWQNDIEFQNDCLAYTLFHGQNRITSSEGTNHWIPFTEYEVNAQAKFESNFMTDFIKGKIKQEITTNDLFVIPTQEDTSDSELAKQSHKVNQPLQFSEEATAVFDAGRELWKYYHAQKDVNVNASLYDIREYFQGRNDKGRMNSKSDDATYTQLIAELRNKLAVLADKIKPKVYEYGFLKE
ncbi:hypothetical protein [Flavobacterium dankookense]|uniref:Uncharacterized protein n=1 Tax=Flavobacterium dankookense TaxID=706186 RepID=A0A4R6Q8K7_9FLAO|nr:hypothetical protein [Flavobacterium dankookense]TDP58591.1 hypothetical protein BC748_1813 [Flavobacterium dankookense]